MTDRELLELAAKAAGYNYSWSERYECAVIWSDGDKVKKFWQPHVDDGDALRLAVKLHMQVSITTESCRAETLPVLGVMVNDNDEFAATRRAIVMAAANAWADKP